MFFRSSFSLNCERSQGVIQSILLILLFFGLIENVWGNDNEEMRVIVESLVVLSDKETDKIYKEVFLIKLKDRLNANNVRLVDILTEEQYGEIENFQRFYTVEKITHIVKGTFESRGNEEVGINIKVIKVGDVPIPMARVIKRGGDVFAYLDNVTQRIATTIKGEEYKERLFVSCFIFSADSDNADINWVKFFSRKIPKRLKKSLQGTPLGKKYHIDSLGKDRARGFCEEEKDLETDIRLHEFVVSGELEMEAQEVLHVDAEAKKTEGGEKKEVADFGKRNAGINFKKDFVDKLGSTIAENWPYP